MAGYNNPVMVGVVEVLANGAPSGIDRSNLRVLSIGTGAVPRQPGYRSPNGLVSDVKKAAMSILDDPPETATFVAHLGLGGGVPAARGAVALSGPIVRMNPVARVGRPGVSGEEHAALSAISLDAVTPADVQRIVSLCERWLANEVPNQPIRPATGQEIADIGHDTFASAKLAYEDWAKTKQDSNVS